MQEHRVEGKGHALPLRRVQRHHRLAVAVVAGLDAGEQQRRVAERALARAGVVGLCEVRLGHRVLMLQFRLAEDLGYEHYFLTVADEPFMSAMTISPLSALRRSLITTKSPSRICSSIIEFPRTRRT